MRALLPTAVGVAAVAGVLAEAAHVGTVNGLTVLLAGAASLLAMRAVVGYRRWRDDADQKIDRMVDAARRGHGHNADPWQHGRETLHQEYVPQVLHDMMGAGDDTRELNAEDFPGYRGARRSLKSGGLR